MISEWIQHLDCTIHPLYSPLPSSSQKIQITSPHILYLSNMALSKTGSYLLLYGHVRNGPLALGSKFSHFLIFESSFEPSLHLPALDYFFVPGASGLRLLCWPLMKLQILRSVREFFIFLKFLSVHFLITPFVSVTPSQREQVEVQQRVGSETY